MRYERCGSRSTPLSSRLGRAGHSVCWRCSIPTGSTPGTLSPFPPSAISTNTSQTPPSSCRVSGKCGQRESASTGSAFTLAGQRRRIALPTYPFERQDYWLQPEPRTSRRPQSDDRDADAAGMDSWFYTPTWERTRVPAGHAEPRPDNAAWLIVGDRYGGGAAIKAQLDRRGIAATLVRFGERFARRRDGSFEVNPARGDDYRQLLALVTAASAAALNIVHLGALTRTEPPTAGSALNQDYSFYSLLYIAQAIGDLGISVPVTIGVVSNGLHDVTGEEALHPGMATVLGACGVIPKEFPNVRCFNVDLADNRKIDDQPQELLIRILSEFSAPPQSRVIAYRGRYRWERRYHHVSVPAVTCRPRDEGAVPQPTAPAPRRLSHHRRDRRDRARDCPVSRHDVPGDARAHEEDAAPGTIDVAQRWRCRLRPRLRSARPSPRSWSSRPPVRRSKWLSRTWPTRHRCRTCATR